MAGLVVGGKALVYFVVGVLCDVYLDISPYQGERVEQILEQRFPDSDRTEQTDENALFPSDLHEPMLAYAGDDLIAAAQSSFDFWDNPFDDEDWNET